MDDYRHDSDEELVKRRRRFFLYLIGFVLLVLTLGQSISWLAFGGQSSWFRNQGNRPSNSVPVATTALELSETYRARKGEAKLRFSDRPVIATGSVVRVEWDATFGPDIMLATSDPAKPLRVDLIEGSREEAAALKTGQTIMVGCTRVEEYIGPDPWLRDCQIQAAPALPAPSETVSPATNLSGES